MWDTESRDVTIKCYEGYGNKIDGPALADGPEFTIIECGSDSTPNEPTPDDSNDEVTKEDMVNAINDYLVHKTITHEECIEIINQYYGV